MSRLDFGAEGICYLVCSTHRSGSTLLCELLKCTEVAGSPTTPWSGYSARLPTGTVRGRARCGRPHPRRHCPDVLRLAVPVLRMSRALDAARLPLCAGITPNLAAFGQIHPKAAGRAGAVPGLTTEGDRRLAVSLSALLRGDMAGLVIGKAGGQVLW
jgi:hypothetical protein